MPVVAPASCELACNPSSLINTENIDPNKPGQELRVLTRY
jgi:hypothetical protein